jgi:drug/metabolite transporter (DMT)-like permease
MWLVYAFLAAASFGARGILYQRSSKLPINRNLMLLGVYLTGTILTLAMAIITGQSWTYANLIGILMGSLSFGSNGAMYQGFAVGRASLIAILTGLAPIIVVIGGYLMFDETLNLAQMISFVVVLLGIILIRYSGDLSLKQLNGVQWGVIAMVMFGATDLAGKGAMLLQADVFPTLFFMFTTGSVWFYWFWQRGMRRTVFPQGSSAHAEVAAASETAMWTKRKTVLWGMVVGLSNVLGMIFILYAFQTGLSGLVSAIVAANVLIIVLYARLFLKEKFQRLEGWGIAVTFLGILLLRLMS